ncbi:GNAT family N-acetyltransferase [Kitasatospora mediocidica]|uniref:GNAT family N-acetyltransferase n=1 Tax=Kitasatospora mediocidica TaxID=58352 RepID=UPI0005637103|nr:GNAT family protein [Kitasatospora mediocidica]
MNRVIDQTAPPLPTGVRPPERLALPGGVSLRRRTADDIVPFNAAVVRNLEHLRPWMPWAVSAPTLERTGEMTEVGRLAWEDGTDFLYLAGLDAAPGSVLGAFGLHGRIGPGALEIGYWVDLAFTGRGIATDAAAALTAAALELPGIHRTEIHCDQANAASATVPRKLGYRLDRVRQDPISAPAETGRKLIWVKEIPVEEP